MLYLFSILLCLYISVPLLSILNKHQFPYLSELLSNLIMVSKPFESSIPSLMTISSKSNLISFKHALSVKMKNEFYLLWKRQGLAAIRGHKLLKFLESSAKQEKFLFSHDEDAGNVNSDFRESEQQDQLLVSWLLSLMSRSSYKDGTL